MSVEAPSSTSKQEKQYPASLIENLCQCQICYMNYNETTKIAQMLHCGHTFCQECITSIQKYGNSAHLECPTCRAETKCTLVDVAPNFLAMEMIRKFGLMGVAEVAAPVKEPKLARGAQRERTIDEMVDEKYRQLIADVKGELMAKFEELRGSLSKSTIHSVQSELECLSDTVMDAVRDAYDGISESEEESSTSFSTALSAEESDEVSAPPPPRNSLLSRPISFIRRIFRSNTLVVENPANTSSNRSDESSESSDGSTSDSDSDDEDSNDGSSEMSEMTSGGE